MLINVGSLSKQDIGLSKSYSLVSNFAPLEWCGEKLSFSNPVQAELTATNTARAIEIKGIVKLTLSLTCSRCLELFDYDITFTFEEIYYPDTKLNLELASENQDINYRKYQGETIDLTEAILENVLLEIPIKPICQNECKGLCSSCGINLNGKTCTCCSTDIDPRLEVLKNLLKSNE